MKLGVNFAERAPFELSGNGRFVISRQNFVPAYVRAFAEGVLQERADQAIESLRSCRVCPREYIAPFEREFSFKIFQVAPETRNSSELVASAENHGSVSRIQIA